MRSRLEALEDTADEVDMQHAERVKQNEAKMDSPKECMDDIKRELTSIMSECRVSWTAKIIRRNAHLSS